VRWPYTACPNMGGQGGGSTENSGRLGVAPQGKRARIWRGVWGIQDNPHAAVFRGGPGDGGGAGGLPWGPQKATGSIARPGYGARMLNRETKSLQLGAGIRGGGRIPLVGAIGTGGPPKTWATAFGGPRGAPGVSRGQRRGGSANFLGSEDPKECLGTSSGTRAGGTRLPSYGAGGRGGTRGTVSSKSRAKSGCGGAKGTRGQNPNVAGVGAHQSRFSATSIGTRENPGDTFPQPRGNYPGNEKGKYQFQGRGRGAGGGCFWTSREVGRLGGRAGAKRSGGSPFFTGVGFRPDFLAWRKARETRGGKKKNRGRGADPRGGNPLKTTVTGSGSRNLGPFSGPKDSTQIEGSKKQFADPFGGGTDSALHPGASGRDKTALWPPMGIDGDEKNPPTLKQRWAGKKSFSPSSNPQRGKRIYGSGQRGGRARETPPHPQNSRGVGRGSAGARWRSSVVRWGLWVGRGADTGDFEI